MPIHLFSARVRRLGHPLRHGERGRREGAQGGRGEEGGNDGEGKSGAAAALLLLFRRNEPRGASRRRELPIHRLGAAF